MQRPYTIAIVGFLHLIRGTQAYLVPLAIAVGKIDVIDFDIIASEIDSGAGIKSAGLG